MKITKRQLRKIIRETILREQGVETEVETDVETEEETDVEPKQGTDAVASIGDLKTWFITQKDTVEDVGIKTTNIPAVVGIMEALLSAAAVGDIKTKAPVWIKLINKVGGGG